MEELDLESKLAVPESERTDEMYNRIQFFQGLRIWCCFFWALTACFWVTFVLFFGTAGLFTLFKQADAAVTWKQ